MSEGFKYQEIGSILNKNKNAIANAIVNTIYGLNNKEMIDKFEITKESLHEFAVYDISKLFTSVIAERPSIFAKYIAWQRSMMESREVPIIMMKMNIAVMRQVVKDFLPDKYHSIIEKFYIEADDALSIHGIDVNSYLTKDNKHFQIAEKYLALALNHQSDEAINLILEANQNIDIRSIYLNVLQPVQYEVGRLWQINKISVAKEHYVTDVTKNAMSLLINRINDIEKNGHYLIAASMGGELHEMGLRFVSDYFKLNGWEVIFFGANTPKNAILNEMKKLDPSLVAISATTSNHIYATKLLVEEIRKLNIRAKILVGGYVFNAEPDLYKYVDADEYAPNAESAVEIADKLVLN